jgi:pSer/pThr/pTyr-binding forkhead associated (FHA) protein
LTSNVSPAERVFTLNPDRPSIPIGRASKSVSKGLLGAVDNAWFDSPVMSRDHAEMTIDVEEKVRPSTATLQVQSLCSQKITIQDIGSMHGTYLNGVELPRKTPMAIDDGDILVFGAEVRRGPETFPACKFQVKYQFVPYK